MTPKRLFLFCLLLLALAWGLWQWAQDQGQAPSLLDLPEPSPHSLFQGNPSKIQKLTIEQPRYGRLVQLEQNAGQWQLTDPLLDVPEPFVLQGALQALYGRDWRKAPEEWLDQSAEDLGLLPAAAIIEVVYADGEREELVLGAEEESGNWRVARHNDQLLRFPIPGFRLLARPTDQWRDHRLHPLGTGVTAVVWHPHQGEMLRLERQHNRWYLRQPVEAPLSEQAKPFLLTLIGARVDGVGSEIPMGFTADLQIGSLDLYRGQEKVELQIFPGGILSNRRKYLLSYDKHNFQFLQLSLEEMISRRILDLDSNQIVSMRLEYRQEAVDYRRTKDQWMRNSGSEVDAKESAFVAALLKYGQTMERGEQKPLPQEPPAGRILYCISRLPQEQGAQILRWWVDEDGTNWVASEPGSEAYRSSINFELGVQSLFAEQP